MNILAAIGVAVIIIIILVEAIGELSYILGQFLANNIFIILAIGCLGFALFMLIYFKPHPAEKYFESYKNGKLTRHEAIEKIANTTYVQSRDGIPPAYKSKLLEKRINSLRKRVRAETQFMEELIEYIKTKSRTKQGGDNG